MFAASGKWERIRMLLRTVRPNLGRSVPLTRGIRQKSEFNVHIWQIGRQFGGYSCRTDGYHESSSMVIDSAG